MKYIGIVICGMEQNRQFVPDAYIRAVRHAGGVPILLPMVRSLNVMEPFATLCGGFLFCGGGDISPLLFGQNPLTSAGSCDRNLDIFQIRLMQQILQAKKPVLAICRGMQVLNVALGGTIYQDLSLCPGEHLNHMQIDISRQNPSHSVKIKRHTTLHQILEHDKLYVNSYHHQAVCKLGKGLIASAISPDHIIEAIELPHADCVIGVQWHPECMTASSKAMQRLFRYLVNSPLRYSP